MDNIWILYLNIFDIHLTWILEKIGLVCRGHQTSMAPKHRSQKKGAAQTHPAGGREW